MKPERSRSFDIGIEQFFWKDRLRVEGVYFKNRFRDQIAFIADPATSGGPVRLPDGRMTNFINNDRATAGASSSVSTRPNRWLRFDGAYTLLNTNLDAASKVLDSATGTLIPNPEVGLPLYRRPRHSGSASVASSAASSTRTWTASLLESAATMTRPSSRASTAKAARSTTAVIRNSTSPDRIASVR